MYIFFSVWLQNLSFFQQLCQEIPLLFPSILHRGAYKPGQKDWESFSVRLQFIGLLFKRQQKYVAASKSVIQWSLKIADFSGNLRPNYFSVTCNPLLINAVPLN